MVHQEAEELQGGGIDPVQILHDKQDRLLSLLLGRELEK